MKTLCLSFLGSLSIAGFAYAQAETGTAPASTVTPEAITEVRKTERYPLIMMAVLDNDEDFKRMADMGISHVHTYGGIFSADPEKPGAIERVRQYLDLAQKHGLNVMFDLDGGRRVARGKVGLKQMLGMVEAFKDHPAVDFWYAYDEPNLPSAANRRAAEAARLQDQLPSEDEATAQMKAPPKEVAPFYKAIKNASPDIPIILLMWITDQQPWRDSWKQYSDILDIISFNTYPVYHQSFPEAKLDRVTKWTAEYKTEGNPVMPCLQVFNWTTIPGRVERAKAAGQDHTDQWRYPNQKELRYWNFSSLIQGAPALLYYTYGGRSLQRRAPEEWLNGDLKGSMLEIRAFTDLIAGAEKTVYVEGGEEAVFLAKWKQGEKSYIALTNGKGEARTFTHAKLAEAFGNSKATPWSFTRADALVAKGGKASAVQLEPWETLVWEVNL